MKNAFYLLIISLFVLSGCNNQSLESTEQSVSRTQQVKISLGDDFSSRSNRYKGNYDDVTNGGSVVPVLCLPLFRQRDRVEGQHDPTGTDWSG